jgi:hypothetical protein
MLRDNVLNKLRDQGGSSSSGIFASVKSLILGDEDTASRGSSHLAREEAMGQKEKNKACWSGVWLAPKQTNKKKAGTSLAVAGHVYDEMLVLTRSLESCRIRLSLSLILGDTRKDFGLTKKTIQKNQSSHHPIMSELIAGTSSTYLLLTPFSKTR